MNARTKAVLRPLIIIGSIGLIVICLVIAFISPLTKYLIQRYDMRLIGRQVRLDWAYVNPFTGYVLLHNVTMLEAKSDSTFFSATGLSLTVSLRQLFSQKIEIRQLSIDRPWVQLVQRNKHLNISDLLTTLTPNDSLSSPSAWKFNLLHTQINEGEFHYRELVIPIDYFIKNISIKSEGKEFGVDTLAATFYFEEGKGNGHVNGKVGYNAQNTNYRLSVNVHDFDLEVLRQYIWELINYGMFRARLDGDLHAKGNLHSKDNISLSGQLALRDFHLGKTTTDDYLAFKKLQFTIGEVSPVHRKFIFDSIVLTSPYLKYERYDSLDNLQTLFGKKGKNITDITSQAERFNLVIEIARYVKVLSRNFFRSDYKIDRLKISNGIVVFNDYSIAEKFSIQLHPMNIEADSINKNSKRVGISFLTSLKPYGAGKIMVSLNPKDSADFDMRYSFEKLPATIFNPYLITYTSFPLDRGTLELNGNWQVRNGEIKSNNHVVVIDPRVSKRVRNKDLKWIPMPLIMAFIRERGNVIDYQIPISGNLKKPTFHLRDVIIDVVKNIFVKPPSTPYRLEVKELETEIEKLQTIKWEFRQYALQPHQQKFLRKIADFLKDHPAAVLNVHPMVYDLKEKEHILFFETKKKYFLLSHPGNVSLSEDDSLFITKMSIKDVGLVAHISKNLSDTVMFTLQEKCLNFIDNDLIRTRLEKLSSDREKSFRQVFLKNDTDSRVKILKSENSIPYNGFSYFKLAYPGEIPAALQRAYDKMNDLNDEGPRKKYRLLRKSESKR